MKCLPLGATIAMLLLATLGLAQTPEQTVFNAGFEKVDPQTGVPLGWTPWAQTGNLAYYTLATAHTGVACAMITDDSSTLSQGLRCRPVAITGGKVYEGSVWVKIDRLQTGGFAVYLEFWRGDRRLTNQAVSTSQVGDWVHLAVKGAAPAEAQAATVLIYSASASQGFAYFDDAALTLVQ